MVRKIRNKPAIAVSGARKVYRDASLIVIACEGEKTEYGTNTLPQNPSTGVGKLIKNHPEQISGNGEMSIIASPQQSYIRKLP